MTSIGIVHVNINRIAEREREREREKGKIIKRGGVGVLRRPTLHGRSFPDRCPRVQVEDVEDEGGGSLEKVTCLRLISSATFQLWFAALLSTVPIFYATHHSFQTFQLGGQT